jgi:site-specific recombinase XerC
MNLTHAIDAFIADLRSEGRITSAHTELAYRTKLEHLVAVTGDAGADVITAASVKDALSRWQGASRRQAHAIYRSFFAWCVYEQIRESNPAAAVRPTRAQAPQVYRLTRAEVVALLDSSMPVRRDRWVVHLGVCAGLRSQELRGLQGRHLARAGWVWVDQAIGKGGRERWVPVLGDLADVVDEIITLVGVDEYVLPGRSSLDPPRHTVAREHPHKMLAASSLYRQVVALGERAGLAQRVTPHVLRRAFAEHVARSAGLRVAQELMGHVSVQTTTLYTERPNLDELAASVRGFSFHSQLPRQTEIGNPHG